MFKKIISASLVGAMFVFSGCGDQEAVDRLESQQSLDQGDFSSAIASLESKANKTDEDKMVLASAYMGEAGFSFSDTLSMFASASSDGNDDTFGAFAGEVEEKKKPTTLTNLQKAIEYYEQVGTSVNNAPMYRAVARASSNSTGDKDLFLGLAYLTKSTVVMSYLGQIKKLQDSGSTGKNLLASSCAITYVYSNNTLANGCASVTPTIDGNYTRLDIVLNGDSGTTYKRLANSNGSQVFLSDYKETTLTPILINTQEVTIEDALVETMNNGFMKIVAAAPEDTKADIYQFKRDIIGDDSLSDESVATTDITVLQLANYLTTLEN